MEDIEFLHLVKFKKISGEQRDYKEIATNVLQSIRL